MRLWHKDLIPVLPRQQLIAQWRECCCIARNIEVNGTPNHILVNKIMEYPIEHFIYYTLLVYYEMLKRGYKCDLGKFEKHCNGLIREEITDKVEYNTLFSGWHNNHYLLQNFYNLQEKYDCCGIRHVEWRKIENFVFEHVNIYIY